MATQTDLEHLTDQDADALLSSAVSKTVNEEVVWTSNDRPAEVRFDVQVFNSVEASLRLAARIHREVPWRSHWMLLWGRRERRQAVEVLRRLDLRDDHRNPDGTVWAQATHKHRWSSAHNNAWAYTPTDIPAADARRPDELDNLRAIFEAFAKECGIHLGPDFKWTDPGILASDTAQPLWSLP